MNRSLSGETLEEIILGGMVLPSSLGLPQHGRQDREVVLVKIGRGFGNATRKDSTTKFGVEKQIFISMNIYQSVHKFNTLYIFNVCIFYFN